MKQKHFIDFFKGATAPVMLGLLVWFEQWNSTTAWLYVAMHGTYGVLWVFKSRLFGDPKWDQECGPFYALYIAAGLTLYWLGGWIVMSQGVEAAGWYLAICVSLFGFGVFTHFVSDMQKHIQLKLKPGHLIDDIMFARIRNTNYFGELLIYSSFGLLAQHWIPIAVILLFIAWFWWPNMRIKDKSLSRYPGFALYKARTKLFLPLFW